MRRGIALALAAALAGASAWAQGKPPAIRLELPVLLDPPPSLEEFTGVTVPGYEPRLPDGEAGRALLAEAYWLVGGMIRGFDFVYTPSDRARAIAESFEARPSFSPEADPTGFSVASVRRDGAVVLATVEYALGPAGESELAAWSSSGYAVSRARGTASALASSGAASSGLPAATLARREAVLAAAREAIRAYLRGVTHNKPREARGSFSFAAPPRIYLKAGVWVADLRVFISVQGIADYGVY